MRDTDRPEPYIIEGLFYISGYTYGIEGPLSVAPTTRVDFHEDDGMNEYGDGGKVIPDHDGDVFVDAYDGPTKRWGGGKYVALDDVKQLWEWQRQERAKL